MTAMIETTHLLAVIDAFAEATSVKDVTLSHRIFGDSKKIAALRGGADITLGRFNAAMQWLSDNWPEGAEWPGCIARPEPEAPEVAA